MLCVCVCGGVLNYVFCKMCCYCVVFFFHFFSSLTSCFSGSSVFFFLIFKRFVQKICDAVNGFEVIKDTFDEITQFRSVFVLCFLVFFCFVLSESFAVCLLIFFWLGFGVLCVLSTPIATKRNKTKDN